MQGVCASIVCKLLALDGIVFVILNGQCTIISLININYKQLINCIKLQLIIGSSSFRNKSQLIIDITRRSSTNKQRNVTKDFTTKIIGMEIVHFLFTLLIFIQQFLLFFFVVVVLAVKYFDGLVT